MKRFYIYNIQIFTSKSDIMLVKEFTTCYFLLLLFKIAGYSQNLSSSTPYLNSSSYYGGTSSGYGGIFVPSSSSLKHNLSVPSIPGLSPLSPLSRSPTPSQFPSRSSSFNRHRSRQRARSVGGSAKSLLSEGYQVRELS